MASGVFIPLGVSKKKKEVSRTKSIVKCPCCRQARHITECRIFSNQLRIIIANNPNKVQSSNGEIIGNYYWHQAQKDEVNWACDECLASQKAIVGDPNKQLFCDFAPHFAYFDKEKECRVCKERFVFNKNEQQHWYEQLQFWVQATRVYCPKCQSEKKQRDHLSLLLQDFDYQDTERLKEIVRLYVLRKEYVKAKYHLTQGKKIRPRASGEYIELEDWIAEIKQLEKGEKPNA